jgi:hypothetical protein
MELLILFALLQVADIYTTHRILSQGGRELNPVMAWLFEKFGHLPALVVVKGIVVRLVARYMVGVTAVAFGYNIAGDTVLAAFCIIYILIVFHNFNQIRD